MARWFIPIARQAASMAAITAVAGLLAAAMVRTGPGFDSDERLLDPRLDAASRAAVQNQRAGEDGAVRYYLRQVGAAFTGDFGVSQSLGQPVASLIRSRLPQTAELMAAGVVGGWVLAFALALIAVLARNSVASEVANHFSSLGLCMPAAVIAVLMFVAGGPARAVIALVLFPRLFETLRNLLADAYQSPQVLAARAFGARPSAILVRYALAARAPELLGLAGVSVVMAFGACIPVETLCDLPGIGQLAWKAAIARDLPVLIALTLLIALLTQLCNAISGWMAEGFERGRA